MPSRDFDYLDGGSIRVELQAAVAQYRHWDAQQLEREQKESRVTVPLYQYTDWKGLCGIIESQSVWFTDYRHLNDPSELAHGVDVADDVLTALAHGADRRVGLFLQMVGDLLIPKNFVGSLDFFTASFTKQRDDLSQWRAYGNNGRGFALGFSPRMFEVVDGAGLEPNEISFLGPVLYDRQAIFARHQRAIAAAASIFLAAAEAHGGLMADKRVGIPFIRRMADELIASPLIWNCITSKHIGYESEREVRLVLMGQTCKLAPYVRTRLRGSERVPYVAHPFRVQEPGAIFEIVVGPSAASDAKERVDQMLKSHGLANVSVTRSEIPYRG
ncbi:MAG: DUF2971 domain-containing protein [Alphaproteobacteria bacterium]|nr:DUF2971 domain-containing protein [Alphaproteobacteria bacterium]